MRVLIIEDDKNKIEKLISFLNIDEVIVKESLQGGILELKINHINYDLLILDMTVPLWEKGRNDLGGNYEQFGGEKVLREMRRRKIFLPTILFTMFDIFPTKRGNITFNEINSMYKKEFKDFYLGAVFYNSIEENWKVDLSKLIYKISNG